MKIVILGATGATGHHVLEQALAAGHEVTALVRDAAKMTASHPRLKVVTGSVTSVDDLTRAFRGQDAVISALGARSLKDPICAEAATAVVDAMKKANLKRVVWTSAAGVGDSKGPAAAASFIFGHIVLPLFLRHPYANHLKAEEALRHSDLDWTVVRPLQLTNSPGGRRVVANTGDRPLGGLKIARQDVAGFLVNEVSAGRFVRALPMVHT